MIKLAHIVNPVAVGEGSDLFIAQPVTFESMRIARAFADNVIDVDLYCAFYPEDESLVPDDFIRTIPLDRTILDLREFNKKRKLPLVADILGRLYKASNADYFVYTNVDIAVMPYFYKTIADIIDRGIDAFVINRRTITPGFSGVSDIHLMYAEIGDTHLGYDCFVFRRSKYPEYKLGNTCVGVKWVGKAIIANMICNAENFELFASQHLTFHLGNDRQWENREFNDYEEHNRKELSYILDHYEGDSALSHKIIRDMTDEITIKNMSRIEWLLMRIKKYMITG